MNEYLAPAWWCVLQTALVACLGGGAMWLLGRRSPRAAAFVGGAAAATILVVTALVPAPMPRVALWTTRQADAAAKGPAAAAGGAVRGESQGEREDASGGVDVETAIRRLLGAAGLTTAKPQAAWGVRNWAAAIGLIGAAVGLARLAAAMQFVRCLRRSSSLIEDTETLRLFSEVARRLNVRRPVELRESGSITSAAVIGWRRTVVLLPTDRAAWTTEQLRAALAHELAHVVRGDFAWRAAASFAQAIHFFHPLVHWLTRRLALVQELAADELAATVAGGPAVYLRALSELAVRLDDQRGHDSTRLRSEPIVLPALSSHLMRRIVMLRSKEGSTAGGGRVRGASRSAAGIAAAGLIALTGVATMALRGSAESVGPTPASPAESTALFARQPIDPAVLRRPDAGVFIVRFAGMSQRPALVPLVELYNRCLQDGWKAVLGVERAPKMHLEEIEYVAGAATMTLKPKTAGQMGQTMLSCEEFVVKFNRPVAWKSWMLANVAGAEEVQDEGFEYVALPTSARLGKLKFCMAARDEQTIVLSANVDRLRELATGEPAAEPHASAAEWMLLDGGLMAFLSPLKLADFAEEIGQLVDPAKLDGDPASAVMQAICLNVQELGGGFDLAGATDDSGVRVCLTCADSAKAEQLKRTLEARRLQALTFLQGVNFGLVDIARTEEDKAPEMQLADGSGDAIDQEIRWSTALLGSSTLQLEARDDGRVDVRIEAQAKFPALVLQQYVARRTKEAGLEAK